MTLYCNPDWQSALESQQFATFAQIWDAPIEWIDEPNRNRGGWSGVGCMQFEKQEHVVGLYVKKQQNHVSRSLLHPVRGEPTFAKEFKFMRYLARHGVMTPQVVFFAQRTVRADQQAILITQNLEGFSALDQINRHGLSLTSQRELIAKVAQAIRAMHNVGIQHRALYAKHIFVKPVDHSFVVALIDFEKSRRMLIPRLQAISDLITFNYRTLGWEMSHRLYFFKQYYGLPHLDIFHRMLARWIARKTVQKQNQWNRQS